MGDDSDTRHERQLREIVEKSWEEYKLLHASVSHRLALGGLAGALALLFGWFELQDMIERRVDEEFATPRVQEAIDRRMSEVVKVESRLLAREKVSQLRDQALGRDRADAYDELERLVADDPQLRDAATAAITHIDSFLGSLFWEYEREKQERATALQKLSPDQLLTVLRTAGDPWMRAVAAFVAVSELPEARVAPVLFERIDAEPSLKARLYVGVAARAGLGLDPEEDVRDLRGQHERRQKGSRGQGGNE